MFAPVRRAASLAYLGTLAGTLLSIFVFRIALLSLLFIVLQFCALSWYILSYIPYGRAAATRIIRVALTRAGILPNKHMLTPISPAENSS